MIRTLLKQLLYAIRVLGRDPVFLAVTVVSLGIGFGLNTMLFTAMRHLLFASLPIRHSKELVAVWESNHPQNRPEVTVSSGNFFDLQRIHAFSSIVHFIDFRPALRIGEREEEIPGIQVSYGWNTITGTAPSRGRDFAPDDYSPSAPHVAILSDGCWRHWTNGDEGIIGRSIKLDGRFYAVIGVMPPGFSFPHPLLPDSPDVWVPSAITEASANRKFHGLYVVGRQHPGVSLEQLRKDLSTLGSQLQKQYPGTNKDWSFTAVPLREAFVKNSKRLLLMLFGACFGVLLLGCANTSTLWLGRIFRRKHELAIRLALGASSSRLLGELLIESVIVALLGGAFGIILAAAAGKSLERLTIEAGLAQSWGLFQVDFFAALGVMLVAILVGLLSGILPAHRLIASAIEDPIGHLRGQHRGLRVVSGSFGVLTSVQTGVSATLLFASVVFVQSYWHLTHSNFGRHSSQVIAARVRPPVSRVPTVDRRIDFYSSLLQKIKELPGVDSAAAVNALALPEGAELHFRPESPRRIEHTDETADLFVATPGVFQTIGATILQGRDFSNDDMRGRQPVVIINGTLAERCWPGENPIGRRMFIQNSGADPYIVIGVVHDIDHFDLARRHKPEFYMPFLQRPFVYMWLLIHTNVRGDSLFRSVQNTAWAIDRDVAVTSLSTFDELQRKAIASPRIMTLLVACTGTLASMLTLLGIYSAFSSFCAVQWRDLVVRVALGASRRHIVGLLISKAVILLACGLTVSIALMMVLGPVFRYLIVEYQRPDWPIMVAVGSVFVAIMLLATSIPAFRAARVDPASVLKESTLK
jgi:putative ABC transport system permease protein